MQELNSTFYFYRSCKILIHIFSDIESIKYYCCFDTFLTTVKVAQVMRECEKKRVLPFTCKIIVSPLNFICTYLIFFAIRDEYGEDECASDVQCIF